MRLLALGVRVVLAGLFLYAGAIKASASEEFALALLPFTFVPAAWTGFLAVALAVTEVLAGLLLLLPRVHRIGSAIVLGLCLIFIAALGWALWNGIIVDCACFGRDETPSAGKMILAIGRDILLAAAALFTLLAPSSRQKAEISDELPQT